jgi:GTP cyclohydrolase IA
MLMKFNKQKVEQATRMLLEGIGEDVNREGLIETPKRVADMYEKILNGYDEDPSKHIKLFKAESHDMVIVKDIPFYSFCEHHLILFAGKIHIAYLMGNKMTGLSKLVRMARCYCKRPQVQERLTKQIADCIVKHLAKDCIVYIVAEHYCMSIRGVRAPGTKTITIAARGKFLKAPKGKNPKEEFLKAINGD